MPGSAQMPAWNTAELPEPPKFGLRQWGSLVGPGMLMAGAAIGGGEWLTGPVVTAKYGGAILWVATVSIVAQVFYNVEISRYTLYTGEPIMTGKFRTLPGPFFWLLLYLAFDLGSLMPYQTAGSVTPIVALGQGRMPDPQNNPIDARFMTGLACVIYVLTAVPLMFFGKIYTFVKALMTVKVVFVFGFLIALTAAFVSKESWASVAAGLVQFGNVPVAGGGVENFFVRLFRGEGLPSVDTQMIASLAAFAAIAGVGGMKNSVISNYTRDQGWGMGAHVGVISSIIGGRDLKLSHVGSVFEPVPEVLPRWRRWLRHVAREQWVVWLTGSMVGVALPALLSVEFIPHGTEADRWVMAGMTADGLQGRIGGALGTFCWYGLMACGVLILIPNTVVDADNTVRRWVDLMWTALPPLRRVNPRRINLLYFLMLVGYVALGVGLLLWVDTPLDLIKIYGCIANFALGFSCWHTLGVNLTLLPRPLRPGWFLRGAMVLSGLYFTALAVVTFLVFIEVIR
jgi:hypothetical protein